MSAQAMTVFTVRIPRHVVYRAFVAETVLLNLETGKYHGINPSGGRMLEVLERLGGTERAASELAAEYGVSVDQVRDDLIQFCIDLRDRGLLEILAPGQD